ncbi:ceramidase domain-containing protein [Spartinivicinus ruber]|uniref:ceramidase domain-containing protein n=1 Tax=Spartinivicinus ruber TaxID=2683272 RepID=UPI0013D2AB2D|nr:ceramidase domain-containing protein [Spartinivicinus ruber]
MIDLYCERLGPGLLAEPINAASNLAFFIAAWKSWLLIKDRESIGYEGFLLVGLIITIGIGSTLFHSYATNWAKQLDIIPILLFQLCFVWFYILKVIELNYSKTAIIVIALFTASHLTRQFPHLLNGSLIYAPAFCVIITLAIVHYYQKKNNPTLLISATAIFALSLFFRTIDNAICSYLTIGSHFLWHILNGVLIYLVMKALFTNWPAQRHLS